MLDNYNAAEADRYFCEPPSYCEPEIISANEDNVPDYNCEGCLECDCEHWEKYNDAG